MVQLNNFLKLGDVQSGPGNASSCWSDKGTEVGIGDACGFWWKKDFKLPRDK